MSNDTEGFLNNLPDVSFIDYVTLDEIQAQMIQDYQDRYKKLTGNEVTLKRADPITLLLYACSIQIFQALLAVDRAGKMDLLKYSYGDYLDNLAAYKGVTRNPAQEAKTEVRFTLSGVQKNAVSIPKGTRVMGENIYFATNEYMEIKAGDLFVDVPCTCTTAGSSGNNILAGDINTLVDQIAYVEKVENITETSGGSDIESDESLAERVYLAPAKYSTAGPKDAYIEFTKAFNQAIGDVNIKSPSECVVEVRVLMEDGSLPTSTMISELTEHLNDTSIRPLTDHVLVLAPDTVSYNLKMTYYVAKSDADKSIEIQNQVNAAVNEYNSWQIKIIGRDINPSELIKKTMAAGAKRVDVTEPIFTKVSDTSVARTGTISVTYGGIEDD